MNELSTVRLYLMRAMFFLNLFILGMSVWPAILSPDKPIEPMRGIALALWGTLSLLSILGLRHPVRMAPVLLFQFTYKAIWLLGVWLPLRNAGQLDAVAAELFKACAVGIVLDTIVMPWGYLWRTLIMTPGDRWKRAT
jgi:hypothetical protein